MAENLGFALLI